MPKFILSLDTEDFVMPEATEGVRIMADVLERHGFQGNFCVVAELARLWERRGQHELIRRLATRHVVGYHSARHSLGPLDVDLVQGVTWSEGVRRIEEDEREGLDFVRRLFEQDAAAYVVPGFDWSAQSVAAMKRLGVDLVVNEGFSIGKPGVPFWFCGSLIAEYDLGIDAHFGRENWPTVLEGAIDRLIESRGAEDYVIVYIHPNMIITREFSDAVNFSRGQTPAPDTWRPAPIRPKAEIRSIEAGLDRLFAHLQGRGDVIPSTYRELLSEYARCDDQTIDAAALEDLARSWLALPADRPEPHLWPDVSPADLLATLARRWIHGETGGKVRLVRALGPVETCRDRDGGSLAAAAVPQLAKRVVEGVESTGALPATITIEGISLGPSAALTVVAQAALDRARGSRSPDRIAWSHDAALPPFGLTSYFRDLRIAGSWPIFRPDLDDTDIVQAIRSQSWTVAQALKRSTHQSDADLAG